MANLIKQKEDAINKIEIIVKALGTFFDEVETGLSVCNKALESDLVTDFKTEEEYVKVQGFEGNARDNFNSIANGYRADVEPAIKKWLAAMKA